LNHREPYRFENQPSSFTLEEEFVIDFERADLAELGMGAVRGFDVDLEGNIFCLSESKIYKFDAQGGFLKGFGTQGQGPGEYARPGSGRITASQEIALYDGGNKKFLLYDTQGAFIKEIKDTSNIQLFGGSAALYLDGNAYLIEEMIMDPQEDKFESRLAVLDAGFQKIAELRERTFKENPFQSNRYNMFDAYNRYVIAGNRIYAASQSNQDFAINVYDFSGRHIRSIRKEYIPVPISEEFKQETWKAYSNSSISELLKSKGYFQKYFPPIKNFYVDEKGRILLETYLEGPDPGEEMLDIFNSEGAYIGRRSLNKAMARRFCRRRMYAVFEKDSGFQKLAVYKLSWD